MRTVFSWSYRRLEPDAARLFRLCAFTCGHPDHPIAPFPATALLGGGDVRTSRRLFGYYLHTATAAMDVISPGGPPRRFRSFPRPVVIPPLLDAAAAHRWLGEHCRSILCVAEFAAETGHADSLNHLLKILDRHGLGSLEDLTRLHALTRDHRPPRPAPPHGLGTR